MSKIAIVTDSNSGITQAKAKELGISVLPMPFMINDNTYFEDINLTQEEFYKMLEEGAEISTSQPAVGDVLDLWDKLLKEYDEIVHIPMSSGLSGTCSTATMLSEDYDGKVHVVDNQRISVTLKQSVLDAMELAKLGKSGKEIKDILEATKSDSTIYLMVDSLKYLKKGGRITPAVAAIGTVLNLKPVLQFHGEKLDSYAKVRGVKQAKRAMIEAIQKDMDTRFADAKENKDLHIHFAYTYNKEAIEEFMEEAKAVFPDYEFDADPLSLSVSCHIGPGSLAITCTKKLDILK